jgi:hypothetical protein
MRIKLCLTTALALLLAAAPQAQAQEPLGSEPGLVDLGALGIARDENIKIDVSLRGTLLSLLVEATKSEDPEFSSLVGKLKGIRVQVFSVAAQDTEAVRQQFAGLAQRLEADDWERLVRVRDKKDHVDTYLKTVDNRIAGLVVLAVDGKDEAVFVNIVGDIDPAQIGRIGNKFKIRPLEELGGKQGRSTRAAEQPEAQPETTTSEQQPETSTSEQQLRIDELEREAREAEARAREAREAAEQARRAAETSP